MDDDLSLVESKALIEELKKRFSNCCFVGRFPTQEGMHQLWHIWDGSDYLTTIGMLEAAKERVTREYLAQMFPPIGD